jgi:hypothetical protein
LVGAVTLHQPIKPGLAAVNDALQGGEENLLVAGQLLDVGNIQMIGGGKSW